MTDRVLNAQVKRRWRRRFRRRRAAVEEIGHQAERGLDKLVLRRLNRLSVVRRFVGLWLVLFGLMFFAGLGQLRSLSPYYQSLQPAPGGIYSEGIIGSFTNANPIYANGAANTAVSNLIFSGLFKYDQQDNLAPDLATSWKTDAPGTTYTVNLRKNVMWQDGQPFTSADVVYTYKTIQNTEAQSPLFSSWQGVDVNANGPYQVTFKLDNPLSSFIYNLTNGIVPKHILSIVPAGQLRSAAFNTAPVGTGPFRWRFVAVTGNSDTTRQQQITLAPNSGYWAGKPKLDGFNLDVYRNEQKMIAAFKNKQINAMGGLDSVPAELTNAAGLQYYHTPLNAVVMAFFNNSKPIFSDVSVRKALVSSVDRQKLMGLQDYPANLARGPLLPRQLAGGRNELAYNPKLARSLLDQAGWRVGKAGVRYKDGHPLQVSLVSESTPTYTAVSQLLQEEWSKVGVKTIVTNSAINDLESSTIPNHDYDVLLYGISVGVDPDVFAYWDSSQASTDSTGHSNFSEYKSSVSDRLLEAARTRPTSALRRPKYLEFTKVWRQDAPALALYQPNYLYITRGPVYGYQLKAMDSAADRYANVANWMIREHRQAN